MNTIPDKWWARPVQKVQQAAVILARSRASIYLDVQRGELELVKIGEKSSAITTASILQYCARRGIEVSK
ncbi:transcriptional regulator [Rugamonas sp. A1-17]|nr:transcriptional regulator [Rugamonas sp. A1-17]